MVEQKKLKLKLVLPLTQELWYPGARVLVASSRRHSVLGKLPDKYATSLCTGSKASLVMSAFWCFLGPFSCSLISIFRKLQDSNLLVRYTPPPSCEGLQREKTGQWTWRRLTLPPHILLGAGKVCVFHGKRMGYDPFWHCLWRGKVHGLQSRGTHSEGPWLLTPSLSLKRLFFASLDTCRHPGELTPGTHISFWDQSSGCYTHFNVTPSFHENDLEMTLWRRQCVSGVWQNRQLWSVLKSSEERRWGNTGTWVPLSSYSGDVELKHWFKKRVAQNRTRLPRCLRENDQEAKGFNSGANLAW